MTKKKFLKQLEDKLKVLEEKERKDIIDEYSNMIDEKINEGKIEEEAIKDLGDIDELTKEILKAYKINPDYSTEAASETKKIMNNIESGISSLAKDLGSGTKKLCSNLKNKDGNINIDMLFEIIIKVILLLFGLIILRVPFEIISSLGEELFSVLMYPINNILSVIWQIIVGFVYFACTILIIISVFKKYFYFKETKESKNKENSSKKEIKKDNKEVKHSKGYITLIRILLTFIFLFPIWCINFGLIVAIVGIIYLLIKGIELWGLLILLIGLSFLFGFIADIVNSLIYQKKVYFFPFIISSILITIGSLMVAENFLTYDFHANIIESNLAKEITFKENINEETFINTKEYLKNIIIDDNLQDNEVVININYYSIYEVSKEKNNNIIEIDFKNTKSKKDVYDLIISDLKDKKVYDYSDLDNVIINIYTNSSTRNLIS